MTFSIDYIKKSWALNDSCTTTGFNPDIPPRKTAAEMNQIKRKLEWLDRRNSRPARRNLIKFGQVMWRLLLADRGRAVAQLGEALRYKPEGRGFDYRWRHWNFSLT